MTPIFTSGDSNKVEIFDINGSYTLTVPQHNMNDGDYSAHSSVAALYPDAVATGGDGIDSTDRAIIILRDNADERVYAAGFVDTGDNVSFKLHDSGTSTTTGILTFSVYANSTTTATNFLIIQDVSGLDPNAGVKAIHDLPSIHRNSVGAPTSNTIDRYMDNNKWCFCF